MGRSTFGNARRRASGRWQARYFLDGAWHNAPNTFTTKADANTWLAREQADRSRGAWVDPKSGKETLEVYATRWLDGRSDLRETTRAKYGDLLRRHILPVLGRKELAISNPPTSVPGTSASPRTIKQQSTIATASSGLS